MLTRTQLTLIVIAVIIIILFAITYFVLFRLAFLSRIKLVKNGLEDDKVVKHLTNKYKRFIKHNDPTMFINHYKTRNDHSLAYTIMVNILITIVTIISVTIIIIGLNFRLNNQQIYVDGKTLIVVETGSMSEKNSNNKYLFDNNLNNQIKARSLIGIEKTNSYEKYDICAFEMEGKIIIHRIIEISNDKEGNKIYRFRGDANAYSLPGEFEVTENRILGEYTGFNSTFLGTSILFVQSGIGMISILVSIIIYALYTAYYDKDTKAFEDRCFTYLDMMYPKYHVEHQVYTVYDEPLIIPLADSVKTGEVTEEITTEVIEESTTKEEKVNPFANIRVLTYPEKMINNESYVRDYYNEIKSYILSYKNLTNRISNNYETFKYKLNKVFLLEIRGTKLKLNINTLPNTLDEKYHLKDNTTKKLEDYPVGLRITSDRALKYAKEIIDIILKPYELDYSYEYKDYMTMLILEYNNKTTKRYTFAARLMLSDDNLRNNYNIIKNTILSYKDIKSRISSKGDTFNNRRNKLFMIEIRGQYIRLHIADDINNYDTKYHLKENKNKKATYYPIYLKVKSMRSLKYAIEIIDNLLLGKGFILNNKSETNYLIDYPNKTEIELITLGEIKVRERGK